jgi:hypothetical protein
MCKEYDCPKCGDPVEVGDNDIYWVCKGCCNEGRIDRDAEFVDGMWKDLTSLIK